MLKEKNSPISRSFNAVLFWLIKMAIGTTNLFLAPKVFSETDNIRGRSGFLPGYSILSCLAKIISPGF